MPRFLTPGEKDSHLAEFEAYKAIPGIWRRDHPDDFGTRGRIDHEVLPLVDDLNALNGVCTIQSCCGHRYPWRDRETGEVSEIVVPGQLWIRLSYAVMVAVDARVGELLRHDVICHVQRLYSFRDGTEPHDVLDVQWKDGHMGEARAVIADFFRGVA